jgi:hypothetical protein
VTSFFKCYRCGHMEASVDPEKFLGLPCKECKAGKMEAWRDTDNNPLLGVMPKTFDTLSTDKEFKPRRDPKRGKKENRRRKRH